MQVAERERFLQRQERWFPCGEHRMRYLHVRCPEQACRPPVVFVHGLLGYSFSWRHNLEQFARYSDVYAVDLLGIGHSDRPGPGEVDYGFKATASRLMEFVRSLGHSQVDLVGTSHGGAVAMLAAAEDRVSGAPLIRRMVLVAPAHPFMPNAKLRIALFGTTIGRMLTRSLFAASNALRRKSLGDMYANESLITAETRAGYDVNLSDPRSYDYALEIVRTWRSDMKLLRRELPSIAEVPVLLLWGSQDGAVSADSGLLLRRNFRHAEYCVLPGVGHLPYEEAPEKFNQCVLRYLQS